MCELGRVMGFDGKWAIHPSQIEPSIASFLCPSAASGVGAEVSSMPTRRRLRAGKGAITVEGKMVDAASLRVARAIVAKNALATGWDGQGSTG